MTEPTPTDLDAVANSQSVDAVAASDSSDGAVAPTSTTANDPDFVAASPATQVLGEGDNPVNPNAPTGVVATSSDVVGGPDVVTRADADDLPEPEPTFEGTMSQEDRAEYEQAVAVSQSDNTADSAAVAVAQAAEDERFRLENPDSPIVRAANPDVGGERF